MEYRCPICSAPLASEGMTAKVEITKSHGENGWLVIDETLLTYLPCGCSNGPSPVSWPSRQALPETVSQESLP